MKLPSFRQSFKEAGTTFRRFPVVLCASVLATASALILVDHEGPAEPTLLFNILLAGVLGIPLLTALALLAEKKGFSVFASFGLQGVGVVLLVGYACTIPTDLTNAPYVTVFRFFVLAAALHLFVAVSPFTARGELNGFWNYNKILLLRVLTSVLYSLVLYVGLAIAMAALHNLFGVFIPGKRYFELWILISGVFTTWFFLAGVPDELGRLETLTEYPKGLRVFAQYILLPIVLIYLVILYAYLAKVVAAWDWPQGWVSKLILGFSGTGILSLLLLHPLAGRSGNVWIARVARWFYIVLVPLDAMLLLAVWRRVSEYGVTEGRYIAIALGIWLFFLVLYFALSKTKSIKAIPVSLCLFTFLVSAGPWGMFTVAKDSQIGRLERLVSRTGILTDGKIHRVHGEVSLQDAKQISAILSYLHDNHGFADIQMWFDEKLRADSIPSGMAFKSPAEVAKLMGLEYVERWAEGSGGIVTPRSGQGIRSDRFQSDGAIAGI